MNKRDFRVRLTKKMIGEAYIRLREKKPLHRVTVCELCEQAGVGRGTFYAHYDDVYALHEEIENGFLEEFSKALCVAFQEAPSPRRVCRSVFSFLDENKTLCAIVFDRDNERGLQKFLKLGEELFFERLGEPNGMRRERAAFVYRFVSAGCVACLQDRTCRGESFESFSDEIAELISSAAAPRKS